MTSWREEFMANEKLYKFVKHLKLKSERTQSSYFQVLKGICDHHEIKYSEFDPKYLTQEIYDKFIMYLLKKLKRSTINQYSKVISIISNLYELNINTQLLKETDKESDYITFAELQEVINKADKEAAALAAFIFCTGLRTISVLSIRKEQLVLNTPHPYVKNVLLKGGRKKDVVIMYPKIVKPLLLWYMQFKSMSLVNYDEIDNVFVSQKGESTNAYIYFLIQKKLSTILGRNITPKMLRKGLGVHTKELGLQDEVRRMIMGHRDVKTTIDAYSEYSITDITRELDQKVYKGDRQNWQQSSGIQLNQNNSQQVQQNQEFCPYCNGPVDHEMLLCPHCWEEIKTVCQNCKRFIQADWKKCPYCGTPKKVKRKFEYAH